MSAIKGGGRAILSDSVRDDLIDCLMERQGKSVTSTSSHKQERQRQKFVERLVHEYERRQYKPHGDQDSNAAKATKTSSKTTSKNASGKVRVTLVEAKQKSTDSFQEGTRKLLVLPRNTTIADLLTQTKNKLRIKKNLLRAFVLLDSKEQLDLQGDLSGLGDAATVYVSTKLGATTPPTSTPTVEQKSLPDPLEAVKKAYGQRQPRSNKPPVGPHPAFSEHFDQLPPRSNDLPSGQYRHAILQAVQENRMVVVSGATGCGKSTQIPQFLYHAMKASGREHATQILVTEPRRVAATTLARRVANELQSPPPGRPQSLVGHHVRLDRSISDSAKIVYCTVGILLRRLVNPPGESKDHALSDVSHVVIDEVHERDVNTDFVLTLLREALPKNPHLRIILMSATASAQLFVDYFAPPRLEQSPVVISIPGRTFPVDIQWLPDCQRSTGTQMASHPRADEQFSSSKPAEREESLLLSPRARDKLDNNFIRQLIQAIIAKIVRDTAEGDPPADNQLRANNAILVFLPGKAEIESLFRMLVGEPLVRPPLSCQISKLHSGAPRKTQEEAFQLVSSKTVKIVLATNVAETSITIPDVSHVIDTCRVKESRFNASSRIKELVTVWTSQSSAQQRAGRAGRTSHGTCYRLCTSNFFETSLPAQTPAEIRRTPLDELVLQVCLLYEQRRDEFYRQQTEDPKVGFPNGVNPLRFLSSVPEAPPESSLLEACQHLVEVDAIRVVEQHPRRTYRLTPLGYHLSRLPMDAKVGKVLIVGCLLQCLDGALTVAATLSSTKSCFLKGGNNNTTPMKECIEARRHHMEEAGFGGSKWKGGTVRGDLIGAIACFNQWSNKNTNKDRSLFCRKHALDAVAMYEISDLRKQFTDCLIDAGFVQAIDGHCDKRHNLHRDDALLTTGCIVAGLYPNIATLMRPGKGRPKGGRLLTKDGDICRPQAGSFQRDRIRTAATTGKDAYVVYHNKHRSVGTGTRPGDALLNEVNFISRYALMLFGGDLQVQKNVILVDDWLKFKIDKESEESGKCVGNGAVLIVALRELLDQTLLQQICGNVEPEDSTLVHMVRRILAEHS